MTTKTETRVGDDDMWWVEHHMEEFEAHQGNWIAVIDQRIIASDPSLDKVIDEVERQGLTEPFVTRIPDDVHRKSYFIG
jgi:hypothetical protein